MILLVCSSLAITYLVMASPVGVLNWMDSLFAQREERTLGTQRVANQSTSSGEEMLNQILTPETLITHNEETYEATTNYEILKKIKQEMDQIAFKDNQEISQQSLEAFRQKYDDDSFIEVQYSDTLSTALFNHMHEGINSDADALRFDRILFLPAESNIYLISVTDQTVYGVPIENEAENYLNFENYLSEDQLTEVTPVMLMNARHYISKDKQTVEKATFMLERQPSSFFLGILFPLPEDIRDYSDDVYSRYYANGYQIAINNENNELSFIQDVTQSVSGTEKQKLDETANLLNKLLTDKGRWLLTDYTSESDVVYRKFVNNLPVFGADHVAKTSFKLSNTQITNLQLSTLTIQTQLTSRNEKYEIMSGTNALEILRNNGIDNSEIEDMQLGYRWVQSKDSKRLVELIPAWMIKRDGSWYMLEDIVDMSEYQDLQTKKVDSNEPLDWSTYLDDTHDKTVEPDTSVSAAFQNYTPNNQKIDEEE